MVCDSANLDKSAGRSVLRVTNPQVINGQQTTRTLFQVDGKASHHASVLLRVIRIRRDEDESFKKFDQLVSDIVAGTNRQSHISPSDLMANDRKQVEIERQLRKLNYLYLRKRTTKGEARRAAGAKFWRPVKKEEFAQAVAACELDPSIVRRGKEILFGEHYYKKVFPHTEPNYYLARYWLYNLVSKKARGNRDRTYAKWLVLHHIWSMLHELLRRQSIAEVFRQSCEEDDRSIATLRHCIDIIFKAALGFYRSEKKKDRTVKDIANFVKKSGLHDKLDRYWGSAAQSGARRQFNGYCSRFRTALEQAATR